MQETKLNVQAAPLGETIGLMPPRCIPVGGFVSDIAIFVLKRDVKLQLTNLSVAPAVCMPYNLIN